MTTHRIIVTATVAAALAASTISRGQTAPSPAKDAAAEEVSTETKPIPVDGDDGRCDACGSCVCVHKVCVPRPKKREVKKVCWSYKCEDFCIPGPSEHCGTQCRKDACGWWSLEFWKPTWATIHTRKVPVKTVVTRMVPGFEWKPEERCAACRGRNADTTCAADREP